MSVFQDNFNDLNTRKTDSSLLTPPERPSLWSTSTNYITISQTTCEVVVSGCQLSAFSITHDAEGLLDLSGQKGVTDASLANFVPAGFDESLTALNLASCEITDGALACLSRRPFQAFSTLNLGACKHVTGKGFASLAALTTLKTLSLNGCTFDYVFIPFNCSCLDCAKSLHWLQMTLIASCRWVQNKTRSWKFWNNSWKLC